MRRLTQAQAIPLIASLLLSCRASPPCEKAACFETAVPVTRLELHGKCGERLWALAGDGARAVRDVAYGVVPAGYRQLYPLDHPPRTLRAGECVVLLWSDRTKFTRHRGVAAGPDRVHYGVWSSQPLPGNPDALFDPGADRDAQPGCGPCAGSVPPAR